MNIALDFSGRLYEQIYDAIKKDITTGKLIRGERLPSSRLLAETLSVSRTTVALAYDQLTDEGYIEAKSRSGYYVCDVRPLLHMKEEPIKRRVQKKKTSEKEPDASDGLIDFSPHGVDMSGFPFSTWKRITGTVLSDAGSALFTRGDAQGDYELRAEIARYLSSSRGVTRDAEQIVVGAGDDFLFLTLGQLFRERAQIAFEAATYVRAAKIFESCGLRLRTVATDEQGMAADDPAMKTCNLAFVMPSRQYPTGVTMPIGRRNELLSWAAEKEDRYLIEDDYDSEFRYRTRPVPAMSATDKNEKTIYVGTFSKSIAPAIRVGYMALPKSLLARYHEVLGGVSCTVSRIDQAILCAFLRDGYFERYLNKTRRVYRAKHDALLGALRPLTKRFRIAGADAGLHLLLYEQKNTPRVDAQRAEKEYIRAAREKGAHIYGLHEYLQTKDDGTRRYLPEAFRRPTLILGYGALSVDQIADGVQRLASALNA